MQQLGDKGKRAFKDDKEDDKFMDLLGAKNQDKRYYGWLHMHPLFDGDEGDNDWKDNGFDNSKLYYQNRRGSEQIESKTTENLDSIQRLTEGLFIDKKQNTQQRREEEELVLFQELYAGISTLFEDEVQVEEKAELQAAGYLRAAANASMDPNQGGEPYGFLKNM